MKTNLPAIPESKIQIASVNWFRYQYPGYKQLLWHPANGRIRDNITGAILKAEGVTAGVSDLVLDVARCGYHGLRIEMKRPGGVQSKWQKAYQEAVEAQGYKYVICHSLKEFIEVVNNYLD
ncbi:MAG: VRR-NUC domain-containing protein [Prevotellaceae bacterium]|nr:VRR-NUC domain-containing protein [Prevotellaceae bacterium]